MDREAFVHGVRCRLRKYPVAIVWKVSRARIAGEAGCKKEPCLLPGASHLGGEMRGELGWEERRSEGLRQEE